MSSREVLEPRRPSESRLSRLAEWARLHDHTIDDSDHTIIIARPWHTPAGPAPGDSRAALAVPLSGRRGHPRARRPAAPGGLPPPAACRPALSGLPPDSTEVRQSDEICR